MAASEKTMFGEFRKALAKKNPTVPVLPDLPFSLPENSSALPMRGFEDVLKRLGQAQSSTAALAALGKEAKPSGGRGVLSTLFDQEKGIITAPARFSTAFITDILGSKDENLQGRNPLQSALASTRGEFAITGGDIFKVQDGDSIPERFAKWAGAFAFDVTTDPVSYIGPVNVFSKKGAAASAVQRGDQILEAAIKVARPVGKAESLVDDLFKRSRRFQVAERERALGAKIVPGSAMGSSV